LILAPYSSVHVMYLVIAFLFKFCDVIHLVIGQSVVDVFLVDWERPDSRPETTHAVRQIVLFIALSVLVLFIALFVLFIAAYSSGGLA